MANIIIIEDDSTLLAALTEWFTDEGDVVYGCSGVESALEQIQQERPDLIITDLVMEQVDGFEMLRILQNNEHYRGIPVIVLSNRSDPDDLKRAKELGAEDFLVKAELSLSEIVERVKKVLAKPKVKRSVNK